MGFFKCFTSLPVEGSADAAFWAVLRVGSQTPENPRLPVTKEMRALVFCLVENNFSIPQGDFRENLALNYPVSRAAKLIDYLSCVE